MKRIVALSICLLLVCAVPVAAESSGIYETARDLYEAWVSQDRVPDYITGVWSTDGSYVNLTFGILPNSGGEQEILALVRDDSTVTIVYQSHSRNDLYRVQDEIVDAYFSKDLGLVTIGVEELENRLQIQVHKDYAEAPETLAAIRAITEQYGENTVYFRYVETHLDFVNGTQPSPTGPILTGVTPQDHLIPFGFGLCGILVVFLFFIDSRRRNLLSVTAKGEVIAASPRRFTKKEVETAIRQAGLSPSEALDTRVMESIR